MRAIPVPCAFRVQYGHRLQTFEQTSRRLPYARRRSVPPPYDRGCAPCPVFALCTSSQQAVSPRRRWSVALYAPQRRHIPCAPSRCPRRDSSSPPPNEPLAAVHPAGWTSTCQARSRRNEGHVRGATEPPRRCAESRRPRIRRRVEWAHQRSISWQSSLVVLVLQPHFLRRRLRSLRSWVWICLDDERADVYHWKVRSRRASSELGIMACRLRRRSGMPGKAVSPESVVRNLCLYWWVQL